MATNNLKAILVIAPGRKVKLTNHGEWRIGTVQAVRIQARGYVDYNVIYWAADDRKTIWAEAFEVELMDDADAPVAIGFLP